LHALSVREPSSRSFQKKHLDPGIGSGVYAQFGR
jgi:hypothetical protein